MSFITVEVSAVMPGKSLQTRSVGANLLHAIHGSERATRARSPVPDKLAEPAFLLRRGSANQTLILEHIKAPPGLVRFVEDEGKPLVTHSLSAELPHDADAETEKTGGTTLLLQSMPDQLSREMLLDALHAKGIAKLVDFAYRPFDLKKGVYGNWAYVNFTTTVAAQGCLELLNGFSDWGVPSEKPCGASWCMKHQGLDELIEHYRNSQLMHPKMNDEYKPALFKDGVRIEFPPPTKKISAPRSSICRQRFWS